MNEDELFERLCDPNAWSKAEAIEMAARRADRDPSFGSRLARTAIDKAYVQDGTKALRLLEILSAISSQIRVVVIGSLLNHPDQRVRSKAALLVGHANQNANWVQQRMLDPDARVRSNAIESLWGADPNEARRVFLKALDDSNNRVIGNALVGLHLMKEPDCVGRIIAMSKHADAKFRQTAVWVMRRTEDPAFLPVLSELVRDGDSPVRLKALQALARIKMAQANQAATRKTADQGL